MNALDVLIIIMAISALVRGFDIGLVRQFFSTAGFAFGLMLGIFLEQYTVNLVHTPTSRTIVTLMTTLGLAMIFLSVGELIGSRFKDELRPRFGLDRFDGYFGSVISAFTVIVVMWLMAAVIVSFPSATAQQQIRESSIVGFLNRRLPPAPDVIASLGHLIDPNGFPQVFTGNEPDQPENTTVPGISLQLQAAIDKSKVSTVKIEGLGCGGIVDGSGFVIASDLVATNAHVVAGVSKPYVKDTAGQHSATAVWFDPDLDFAILRVPNLAGPPLLISDSVVKPQTIGAVLGYPGGGPLTAGGAEVIDEFTARGRNIYGSGISERDVYSLAANIIPGNSGGPVITTDGTVVGVVFAQSTSYENVGYALSTPQIEAAVSQAQAQNRTVTTGSCAE
jgi:S1-C subfamily serine protease